MKKLILFSSVLMVSVFAYPQIESSDLQYASGTFTQMKSTEVTGTGAMMLKSGTWIIRVTERSGTTDYVPTNLDINFKVEGLQVRFRGELEEIPENVRMIGAPIKILNIEQVQ